MSDFWKDERRRQILLDCVTTILQEINSNDTPFNRTKSIVVFIANIEITNSIAMEIFDGETFMSRMRFSGVPSNVPSRSSTVSPLLGDSKNEQGASPSSSSSTIIPNTLEYDTLSNLKKKVVDLVDLLQNKQQIEFRRIILKLEQPKHQLLQKIKKHTINKTKNGMYVVDHDKKIWGYALQLDGKLQNVVFERFVKWLEEGSNGGRAPNCGRWDGFYKIDL